MYIDLSGKWNFQRTDSINRGVQEKWFSQNFDETVNLPGSMAINGKGNNISLNTKWTGDIVDSSFFNFSDMKNSEIQITLNFHFGCSLKNITKVRLGTNASFLFPKIGQISK